MLHRGEHPVHAQMWSGVQLRKPQGTGRSGHQLHEGPWWRKSCLKEMVKKLNETKSSSPFRLVPTMSSWKWLKLPTYENINLMTIHYQLIMKWKLRYFGHLMQSQLIGKDPDAGKDGRREEKGATEDEMVGWHHRLDGRESEKTLGGGEGQGGLLVAVHVVAESRTRLATEHQQPIL